MRSDGPSSGQSRDVRVSADFQSDCSTLANKRRIRQAAPYRPFFGRLPQSSVKKANQARLE